MEEILNGSPNASRNAYALTPEMEAAFIEALRNNEFPVNTAAHDSERLRGGRPMGLHAVDHRYVVEGGRLLHYMAMVDPETGRQTTRVLDEGAADPSLPEGAVDEADAEGAGGGIQGMGATETPKLGGLNTETPSLSGLNVPEAFSARVAPQVPYSFGNISEGVGPGGPGGLGSAFMTPSNYNFGDISAGIGPRASGGDMGEPTSLNPQAAQLAQMQQQAQAAMSGAPAPAAAPGAAGSGATNGVTGTTADDWAKLGNFQRFNPENPAMAMAQKMMDLGMQPFNKFNPFVTLLQRAAAGLAASFAVNQANNPANTMPIGSEPPDANKMFSDFLGQTLGKGSVFSTAAAGAGGLKQAIDAARAQNAAGGAQNAGQVNPFLDALSTLLMSNQGEGGTQMLQAMMSPLMPRGLAKGYDEGLTQALANANRGFWSQPAPGPSGQPGQDFMKFLMGV